MKKKMINELKEKKARVLLEIYNNRPEVEAEKELEELKNEFFSILDKNRKYETKKIFDEIKYAQLLKIGLFPNENPEFKVNIINISYEELVRVMLHDFQKLNNFLNRFCLKDLTAKEQNIIADTVFVAVTNDSYKPISKRKFFEFCNINKCKVTDLKQREILSEDINVRFYTELGIVAKNIYCATFETSIVSKVDGRQGSRKRIQTLKNNL